MHAYRKKPVVVRAFQMTASRMENNGDWPNWLHHAWNVEQGKRGALWRCNHEPMQLCIGTLEGTMRVDPNDWIIRGLAGELYPCKPEIFEASYERVEEPAVAHV